MSKNDKIQVKIIVDSITPEQSRMTTFELVYPRIIHSEIMTHKMLAKNSQSSRAVPVNALIAANEEPFVPLVWGKNKSGMSSTEVLTGWRRVVAERVWRGLAWSAFKGSGVLSKLGVHKQWANRPTEPFSTIKVVMTGTEFENFFWLRIDPAAAQPEIVELATKMKQAYDWSLPTMLEAGQWHVPYVKQAFDNGVQTFYDSDGGFLETSEALKISASCCAQVSYRKLDDTKEKALDIYSKLFSGNKVHLSPTEHQGMVMKRELHDPKKEVTFDAGVTALSKKLRFQSGNLTGLVQYRHILEQSNEANSHEEFANIGIHLR